MDPLRPRSGGGREGNGCIGRTQVLNNAWNLFPEIESRRDGGTTDKRAGINLNNFNPRIFIIPMTTMAHARVHAPPSSSSSRVPLNMHARRVCHTLPRSFVCNYSSTPPRRGLCLASTRTAYRYIQSTNSLALPLHLADKSVMSYGVYQVRRYSVFCRISKRVMSWVVQFEDR